MLWNSLLHFSLSFLFALSLFFLTFSFPLSGSGFVCSPRARSAVFCCWGGWVEETLFPPSRHKSPARAHSSQEDGKMSWKLPCPIEPTGGEEIRLPSCVWTAAQVPTDRVAQGSRLAASCSAHRSKQGFFLCSKASHRARLSEKSGQALRIAVSR